MTLIVEVFKKKLQYGQKFLKDLMDVFSLLTH